MQTIEYDLNRWLLGGGRILLFLRRACAFFPFSHWKEFLAGNLIAQTTIFRASAHGATSGRECSFEFAVRIQTKFNRGVTGLPAGTSQLPYPLTSTPANDACVRNNAWAAYNANLHHIPTAAKPESIGGAAEPGRSKSVHPEAELFASV